MFPWMRLHAEEEIHNEEADTQESQKQIRVTSPPRAKTTPAKKPGF
jgi:hypothetical protein